MSPDSLRGPEQVRIVPASEVDLDPEHNVVRDGKLDEALAETLAASIKADGLQSPPRCYLEPKSGRWRPVTGFHRLWAMIRILGLQNVSIIALNGQPGELDLWVGGYVENAARGEMAAMARVKAIAKVVRLLGDNQKQAAARLGESERTVSEALAIAGLPAPMIEAFARGSLCWKAAAALARCVNVEDRARLFDSIRPERLTADEVVTRVQDFNGGKRAVNKARGIKRLAFAVPGGITVRVEAPSDAFFEAFKKVVTRWFRKRDGDSVAA